MRPFRAILISSTLCLCPAIVTAQNCDLVLLATRSYDKSALSLREYYHSINALSSSGMSSDQTSESAALGPLALAREKFDFEQHNLKQTLNLTYTRDESFETIKMQSPPQAIDAWLRCKQSRDTPQFEIVVLGNPEGTQFDGYLYWLPPARQYGAKLTSLSTLSKNIDLRGLDLIPQGKTPISFSRAKNTEAVTGVVVGMFEEESLSATFSIPPWKSECPTAQEKACIGLFSAHETPHTKSGCDGNVKVASQPIDAQRNWVAWLSIQAFGKVMQCKAPQGGYLGSGAHCSVMADGKLWTATLGKLASFAPYSAEIDVSLDCEPQSGAKE